MHPRMAYVYYANFAYDVANGMRIETPKLILLHEPQEYPPALLKLGREWLQHLCQMERLYIELIRAAKNDPRSPLTLQLHERLEDKELVK